MTLLLNAVVRQCAIHASDRLVSLRPSRRGQDAKEWDAAANKSLIVVTTDSWLIISYTGLAYLEGVPTDDWIAGVVTGLDPTVRGLGFWDPGRLHVQEIADRITTRLGAVFALLPKTLQREVMEVHICGVQKAKPRPVHLQWVVFNTGAGFRLQKTDLGGFRWDSGYQLKGGGSWQATEIETLRSKLRAEGDESPARFRDLLAESVRRTAEKSGGVVGRHVMGIILKPAEGMAEATFMADPTALSDREAVSGYSPWGIFPGMVFPPAVITGHQQWEIPGPRRYTVTYVGAHTSSGTELRYATQDRKPPP